LHDVTGLGPEKAKALMRAFGSVAAIRRASSDDLQAVPGIGPGLAERIRATLDEGIAASGDGAGSSEMLSSEVQS
jgi:excinuclease ABC subunit C